MNLTASLALPSSLDIKTSRTKSLNGKAGQKWTLFYSYQARKDQFAQIEHLFSLRYCLYEPAGSFPALLLNQGHPKTPWASIFINGTLRKWQIE